VYDNLSPNRDGVVSTLGAFAIQTHELFCELVNAGFNEQQAISIVVGLANKDK
jgi:hypothetical protein